MPSNNQLPLKRGELPPGYREVLYWKITAETSRIVQLQLIGLPLFAAACLLFFGLAFLLGSNQAIFRVNGWVALVTLAGSILILAIHELVHGVTMRAFGARPRYGILWKEAMLYATTPGFAFRRDQYLSVALAPLVSLNLLSALGLLLLAGTAWVLPLVVCAAINAGGAIGDLWITRVVLRYPPGAYIMDEIDGVRIFLPA
jgi:hypothetical protein